MQRGHSRGCQPTEFRHQRNERSRGCRLPEIPRGGQCRLVREVGREVGAREDVGYIHHEEDLSKRRDPLSARKSRARLRTFGASGVLTDDLTEIADQSLPLEDTRVAAMSMRQYLDEFLVTAGADITGRPAK